MTSEVQTEHIIQIVKNIATLTEKIATLQDSVDIVNSKIDTLSKIEADVLLLKKDLVSTENKANKCHTRVDELSKRVEALEDKGTKRVMNRENYFICSWCFRYVYNSKIKRYYSIIMG